MSVTCTAVQQKAAVFELFSFHPFSMMQYDGYFLYQFKLSPLLKSILETIINTIKTRR